MDEPDNPTGSWANVFTLRERVRSAVEFADEPRDAAHIANLADGSVDETERVLDALVDEGVVAVEDGRYRARE